jgi:hypothetical protein
MVCPLSPSASIPHNLPQAHSLSDRALANPPCSILKFLIQVRCVVVYDEARVEAEADRGEAEGNEPFSEIQTGQARIPDELVRRDGATPLQRKRIIVRVSAWVGQVAQAGRRLME